MKGLATGNNNDIGIFYSGVVNAATQTGCFLLRFHRGNVITYFVWKFDKKKKPLESQTSLHGRRMHEENN